ncbi:MAG: hypothetical protein HN778_20380 [Prolixibacteraceae bacterium]|nr:hypothetical protein [Prolixibacteraceae bacterium]MBT6005631.1 hypothetical protein [Prolixibacteraceae bacterium]MBT6765481.1 hypothetical protein [Prolixibacteraceae bacterium]MBT6996821.1 hypothetical protein [Prolixibacteraceae bacterium]MBT7397194.1 hypothetical protein [Prolixibacteraceae bacterium]
MIKPYKFIFIFFLFILIQINPEKSQAAFNEQIKWQSQISSFKIFKDSLDLPFDSIKVLNPEYFKNYDGNQLKRNKIYWLRLVIDNSVNQKQNNYIHFNSYLSNVKLYQKNGNNNYSEKIGGTLVPEKNRTVGGILKEKVPFTLSEGNNTELFIRVCTQMELVYDLTGTEIISFDDYHQLVDRTYLIQFFFSGLNYSTVNT